MLYIFIGLVILLVLFLYSACVVSGECSKLEEKLEIEEFYGKENL